MRTGLEQQSVGRLIAVAVLAVSVAAVDAVILSASAEAQSSARQRRLAAAAKRDSTPAPKPAPAPKAAQPVGPPQPVVTVVSLGSQRLWVHTSDGVAAESRISSGQSGFRTPTGVFSILQRNRYHESNIYSGAPMPFMQRLTWSGIALHEGVVPNHPASHGCIRMPAGFANRMWEMGRLGMRVIVSPEDTRPVEVSHARLPVPVLTPVGNAIELSAAGPVQMAAVAVAAPQDGAQPVQGGDAAGASPAVAGAMAVQLDPFKLAQARKVKAQADRIAAEKAVKPAFEHATAVSAEAHRAADDLRRAQQALAAAEDDLEMRTRAVIANQRADADSPEGLALTIAQNQLQQSKNDLAEAMAREREKSDAAFAAAKAARAAEAAVDTTSQASREANAGVEPVSIFVSRKEGRVFVRQGFLPLHDEPITFAEPERPVGTHVYTAIDARDGGAALRWIAVTVPSTPPDLADGEKGRKGSRQAAAEPRPVLPASSAATALDRFELPEATRRLIQDRLWPGASITVSDFGISGETGKGTDFIVLTK